MKTQMKADLNPDDHGNAEMLYERYRKMRSELQQSSVDTELPHDSLAAKLYATFQNTRTSDREAIIDSIVLSVRQAREREMEDKRLNRLPVDSESGAGSTARLAKSLLSVPTRLLDRLSGSIAGLPVLLRLGTAVAVAGVLAVLVVPVFYSQPAIDSGIPTSLSRQASVVVPYIDDDDVQAFGFSRSVSAEKNAFNLGRLSATLSIAAAAGQPPALTAVGERMVAMAEERQQDTLAAAATDHLIGATTASVRSDDFAGHIADLQRRMFELSSAPGTSQWFQQGQAIEAIALSGELARQTQDTKPLADALTALHEIDLTKLDGVTDQLPIGLFEELQEIDPDEDLSPTLIRQVLNTAGNIKILMR